MTNIELISKAMRNATESYFTYLSCDPDDEDKARQGAREAVAALTAVLVGMGPDASVPHDLRVAADGLTDMVLDTIG